MQLNDYENTASTILTIFPVENIQENNFTYAIYTV